jgi:hypothetical protein
MPKKLDEWKSTLTYSLGLALPDSSELIVDSSSHTVSEYALTQSRTKKVAMSSNSLLEATKGMVSRNPNMPPARSMYQQYNAATAARKMQGWFCKRRWLRGVRAQMKI